MINWSSEWAVFRVDVYYYHYKRSPFKISKTKSGNFKEILFVSNLCILSLGQDSSLVVPLGPNKLLVGVFDGHGEQGAFETAGLSNPVNLGFLDLSIL